MATIPPPKRQKTTQEKKSAPGGDGHRNEAPLVVFAHGAGAPSTSEWMVRWKKMLGDELGAVQVVTFDYPYISGGKRRAPPKAEKLVDFHSTIVKEAVAKHPGHPLILAGKSMGSRVSCMVAGVEDVDVSAIICLGYPLKGMNGKVRDELLVELKVPVVFVQGSKDTLCPLGMLETTRGKMKAKNELLVIDGGDHSFKIGKKHLQSTSTTQSEAEEKAVKEMGELVSKVLRAE